MLDQSGIAVDKRQISNLPADVAVCHFRFQIFGNLLQQLIQTGNLEVGLLASDSSQIQEIVHHAPHRLCAFDDVAQAFLRCKRGLKAQVLHKHLGEALNVPQRSAEIVRHRVSKGLKLLIGRQELSVALFEAGIELADLVLGLLACG